MPKLITILLAFELSEKLLPKVKTGFFKDLFQSSLFITSLKLLEFVKGGGLAGMAYRKVFGKDKKEDKLESDKRIPIRNRRGRIIGYKDVGNDQVEPILESGDVDSLETSQSKDVEMVNTGSEPTPLTTSSPIVDNTTPLVQANPPQISDVSIKPTEANIPFRKLISSKKYLLVSDMNKSGLPPEIAKML